MQQTVTSLDDRPQAGYTGRCRQDVGFEQSRVIKTRECFHRLRECILCLRESQKLPRRVSLSLSLSLSLSFSAFVRSIALGFIHVDSRALSNPAISKERERCFSHLHPDMVRTNMNYRLPMGKCWPDWPHSWRTSGRLPERLMSEPRANIPTLPVPSWWSPRLVLRARHGH